MNSAMPGLVLLAKRLLLLLIIYQCCRLAFLISNFSYFEAVSSITLFKAFVSGVRFDFAAIMMINLPFAFIHLLPLAFVYKPVTQNILRYFFFITNIPFLLLNCIDLEYFKYQGKRSTADLFQLFGMGDDMKNTIPQMAIDFWYVIAVFLFLSFLLVFFYNRIHLSPAEFKKTKRLWAWVAVLPITALLLIGARGGLQYKPLGILAAAKVTSPQIVPLVLNTPFTVIRTFGKSLVEEKVYMSDEEALKWFDRNHKYSKSESFKSLNVIIIILESFSSEYISAFNNGIGYTPFLDSLLKEGMTFSNAYANAKKSIDGIPAVVASLPNLMQASYISSPYNSNELQSIAGILSNKGYSSAFFHGGNNGTMNFDNFTLMSGFEKYYGRREYPGDEYDGHWGVFDEPFYYFFIDKCDEMKKPFVNAFLSLSSHHPYSIPDHLHGKFPQGALPIHQSIGYADYSLKMFFEKAKEKTWYNNTLFVITSDHTGPSATSHYNTKAGHFRVPILFYHPASSLKGWSEQVTQQTDILPGILDYLNYSEPFVAFGNSMFDTLVTPFAVNYPGDVFQIIGNKYLVQYDGSDVVAAYDYKSDSLLMNNVASSQNREQLYLKKTLQSVIQQYNNALIKNELIPERVSK